MANTLPLTQRENELRAQVAISCRIIGDNNVTKGTLGHVSARVPGTDRILIKSWGPTVEGMEYTTEKDVIVINRKGELLEGAPQGLQQPQRVWRAEGSRGSQGPRASAAFRPRLCILEVRGEASSTPPRLVFA